MLSVTVYNQKGGVGKSPMTRDLGAAFAELGLNVLLVDFDHQNRSLSNYLGVDGDKHDSDADDITLHLIDQGKGDFEDLIRSPEHDDVDVIPSHKRISRLKDLMDSHAEYLGSSKPDDWEYPYHKRFFQLIKEKDVPNEYDVMLVDLNAQSDITYYNALYATRNVLIPAVPNAGAPESIDGVKDSASNFASEMDISITNVGVVPTLFNSGRNIHKQYLEQIREEYPSPVYFKDLTCYEYAGENNRSVFAYLKQDDVRIRNSTADVMPKYRTLATYIYQKAGKELPNGGWPSEELFFSDKRWEDALIDTSSIAKAQGGD